VNIFQEGEGPPRKKKERKVAKMENLHILIRRIVGQREKKNPEARSASGTQNAQSPRARRQKGERRGRQIRNEGPGDKKSRISIEEDRKNQRSNADARTKGRENTERGPDDLNKRVTENY